MPDYAIYSREMVTTPGDRKTASASAAQPADISALLGRIEEAIDAETAALKSGETFDMKAANARKGRCLYELNKAAKSISRSDALGDYREALTRLREKLLVNERMVMAHLEAVGEVAALIRGAIERAETDGTYSEAGFARG